MHACVCAHMSVCACVHVECGGVWQKAPIPSSQRSFALEGSESGRRAGPLEAPGLIRPCPCSSCEGPGHHQVLPAAVQAGRLGVGAELRHRGAQQPLLPAPLHRECQLCPHVSQPYLVLFALSLSTPHYAAVTSVISLSTCFLKPSPFLFYWNNLVDWDVPTINVSQGVVATMLREPPPPKYSLGPSREPKRGGSVHRGWAPAPC